MQEKSIFDHPGFMEYGGWSFEVLHADWPVYPGGHGWEIALRSLAVFPPDVRFKQIDDIDQCFLFVASGSGSCLQPAGDLTDSKWFHVAVWRDDVAELSRRGFISGLSFITEYHAALEYYERHKDLCVETAEGLRPLNLPRPNEADFDSDELVLRIPDGGLTVTPKAGAVLVSIARDTTDLDPRIRGRV